MSRASLLAPAAGERGAVLTEVEDVRLAAHFGAAAAEYDVLRERAAIVDLACDDGLEVTGGDRQEFLHGMLSADIRTLVAGTGCRALLLTDQGKVVADAVVSVAADAVTLTAAAGGVAGAAVALDRYIVADDVELAVAGADEHRVAICGPRAAEALRQLGIAAPPVATYAHAAVEVDGVRLRVICIPDGYLCVLPAAAAVAWWQRALDSGAVLPVGHDAFELLRIERGVPRYGRDVTAETLALEAPFGAAIVFGKGCYLGQEVVERVTARGHVNRHLAGFLLAAEAVPLPGERLLAGDRDVGWLTSTAWSWSRARPIGLGYVRREHAEPGTTLMVQGAATATAATVSALPFP
jgi:folate-binding protein YgfZ